MKPTGLGDPLVLPCGATVKNRILKSAMSETLGTPTHAPQPGLSTLYRRWAEGGLGVSVTGNVMIDARALGEPGNVVIEDDRDLAALSDWAAAGSANGTHLWMQLNHPGKQSPKFLSPETVSPSAIGFGPTLARAFAVPRALEEPEIEDLVVRFGRSAGIAVKAGFTGVQIHGAHGYLVSQFLSPRHNERTDGWGGPLENRARFLRAILAEIRRQVGGSVPVSVKMNSADFQKGGFGHDESLQVMKWLQDDGIDLIEISGGTYEAPAMAGAVKKSTSEREGYFLDFVSQAKASLEVPLCVTGGFRTPAGMRGAIEEGAHMVGLARTLCVQPDFPARVLAGEDVVSAVHRLSTGVKAVDLVAMLDVTWYENQLGRMAAGQDPLVDMSAWRSLATTVWSTGLQAFRMRRAR
ncbi:MAG: NADH:flavin oxidoreductase/NADH oxidase family protein [Myxococcota bacterium]